MYCVYSKICRSTFSRMEFASTLCYIASGGQSLGILETREMFLRSTSLIATCCTKQILVNFFHEVGIFSNNYTVAAALLQCLVQRLPTFCSSPYNVMPSHINSRLCLVALKYQWSKHRVSAEVASIPANAPSMRLSSVYSWTRILASVV